MATPPKKFAIIFFFAVVGVLSGCSEIAPDKRQHAAIGFASAGIATLGSGNWKIGCAAALGLGPAKEIHDAQGHGQVEAMDVVATALPCLVWSVRF